jgi:hypothetical protein
MVPDVTASMINIYKKQKFVLNVASSSNVFNEPEG